MISVERDGDVVMITFRRPDRRNALTEQMLEEMSQAITDLGPDAGCVLIRGEGRVFSGGFDLGSCVEAPDGSVLRKLLTGLCDVIKAMRACPCPVVIAAQGAALAGACALVAASDFALTDRNAKLGYPVVLLGISPAVSAPTLRPAVGGHARGLLLEPGLITGERAFEIRLATDLVEHRDAVGRAALELAGALAAKPRIGIRATKAWLGSIDGIPGDDRVGLDASLGLVGGIEEQRLLGAYWQGRR